jgi:hypothetical protein
MLCLGLLGVAFARADSVTWIDGTSTGTRTDVTLNGHIITVLGGKLILEALFAPGSKMYEIPMNQIRRLEFTNVFFNPGAPPTVSALSEGPKAPTTAQNRPLIADAIELRGSGGESKGAKSIVSMKRRSTANRKAKGSQRTIRARLFCASSSEATNESGAAVCHRSRFVQLVRFTAALPSKPAPGIQGRS